MDNDEVKAQGNWKEVTNTEKSPEELDAPDFQALIRTPKDAGEKKLPAINDLHATYVWMVKHAEELHIDSDRIILIGNSSGGHLATALSSRLKRYGFQPRDVWLRCRLLTTGWIKILADIIQQMANGMNRQFI